MPDQFIPAPAPSRTEFNTLSSTVSGLSDQTVKWFNPASSAQFATATNTSTEKTTTENAWYRIILESTGSSCSFSVNGVGVAGLVQAGRYNFVLPIKAGAVLTLLSTGTTATVTVNKFS